MRLRRTRVRRGVWTEPPRRSRARKKTVTHRLWEVAAHRLMRDDIPVPLPAGSGHAGLLLAFEGPLEE